MSSANTLVITRIFPAPPDKVFAAWTREEIIKTWFCPGDGMTIPTAEVDARVGGNYRIVMQDKDGDTYSPSGTYERIVENKQLVFSWKWADSELVTRVTIDLKPVEKNQTELTLTHEGFPETTVRDKHNEGWDGCLSRLATSLQA
ncbi:MAG: SRPBCC domain-containing protein [Gammaproteobacteria bacterium]|nr:SRPBCC domain-containing protein [Gammaproteobacteria bacterium]